MPHIPTMSLDQALALAVLLVESEIERERLSRQRRGSFTSFQLELLGAARRLRDELPPPAPDPERLLA